ncbi:hypothetical protein DV515_00019249, partial [Chloebia gouldiae]
MYRTGFWGSFGAHTGQGFGADSGRFGSHPCVLKAPPGPSSWNSWCRVRELFPVNRKCSSGTGRRGVLITRTQRRFVRLQRGKNGRKT